MNGKDKPLGAGEALEKGRAQLKPGEKGFAVVILAAAAFMAYQSALLLEKSPDIAGPALMPLIASAVVFLAAARVVISNARGKPAEAYGDKPRDRLRLVGGYLFSTDLTAAVSAIAVYCVCLKLGVSFYIVTPLFLWGLATFYKKGGYLANLIWTFVITSAIYLIFKALFNVAI